MIKERNLAELEVLSSLFFVMQAIARFSWGLFFDMFRFKKCFMIVNIMQMYVALHFMMSAEHSIWFFVTVLMTSFTFGAAFTLFSALCTKIYGVKMAAKVYGVLFLGNGVAAISGPILAFFVLGDEIRNYALLYMVGFVLTVIACFLNIFFTEERVTRKKVQEADPRQVEDLK